MTMTEIEAPITVYPCPFNYAVAWTRDSMADSFDPAGLIGPRLKTYEDAVEVTHWLSTVDVGAASAGNTFDTVSPIERLESLVNGRLAHPSEQGRVA